jgi:hypothetical protein
LTTYDLIKPKLPKQASREYHDHQAKQVISILHKHPMKLRITIEVAHQQAQ